MNTKNTMLSDSIAVANRQITPEGFLKGEAAITCVGVQKYFGYELNELNSELQLTPQKTYSVFRSPQTVFAEGTIESAKMKPITDNHPLTDLDSTNCKAFSVGSLGDTAKNINNRQLCFPVIITDKTAVQKIQNGTHQMSAGYMVGLTEEAGDFEGTPYDLTFDGPMKINHVAFLKDGRCAEGAKIFDKKQKGIDEMTEKNNKTVTDIDMSALVSQIAEKVMPDMQKIIQSDGFTDKLARVIAQSMVANYDAPSPEMGDEVDDQMGNGVESDVKQPMADECSDLINDSKKKLKKVRDSNINKVINDRLKIIETAKQLGIASDYKFENKSNIQILKDSLPASVGDIEDKSMDYLVGVADQLCKRREGANTFFENFNNSKVEEQSCSPANNALELRRIVGFHKN